MNTSLNVIILEKSTKLLSKVKVSGGGRCNVTHACADINDLLSHYPRGKSLLKKAFHHFSVDDTIAWFEQRGVKLKTEADGRMFPVTNQSQTIIDCLLGEAKAYGVNIKLQSEVKALNIINNKWQLEVKNGASMRADFICLACGGFPKYEQFAWLEKTGHEILPPVPSLFTFNLPGHSIRKLQGVSVADAKVKIAGTKLQESGSLLITHWGLSGPAVLKLSAWGARLLNEKHYEFDIIINWLPEWQEEALRDDIRSLRHNEGSKKVFGKNNFALPQRLWEYLLAEAGADAQMNWADMPAKVMNALINKLSQHPFSVKGKTTFKEEFVTCGGLQLKTIEAQTMESKLQKNLFFAGEIMDVDGITGGFNFQHAWTSGWLAAKAIAEKAGK